MHLSHTPVRLDRAGPLLGEHDDDVLAEIGLTPAERAALRAAGVTRDTREVEGGTIVRGPGGEPAGVLKVSMGLNFGADYILPLLPTFLARYPCIRPDWQFTTRQVELIAEGYDAAIGGGIDLATGIVSRTLAPLHLVAVASPGYLSGRAPLRIRPALRPWTGLRGAHHARGVFANASCVMPPARKSP
jgi:DNA-binding transcriptional LysR family regulator